jgi:endonuclease/exonuclease/phosphatase (EEP) superfamily protein YafD
VPRSVQQAEGTQLRILQSNVHFLNPERQPLLDLVRDADPDLVVLHELAPEWTAAAVVIAHERPYTVNEPEREARDTAIFSRYPVRDASVLKLDVEGRPALHARVEIDGIEVEILTLHLGPAAWESGFTIRNTQVAAAVRDFPAPRRRFLVIGDLNMSMWSPYYRDLADGLGVRNARLGQGVMPTWPLFKPWYLRIPIDHVLVSPDIAVVRARVPASIGSDHAPLLVDVAVP